MKTYVEDLSSGFHPTFYGDLEYGRDFYQGEALIAVMENQTKSRETSGHAEQVEKSQFPNLFYMTPQVLRRLLQSQKPHESYFQRPRASSKSIFGKVNKSENRDCHPRLRKPAGEVWGDAAPPSF